MDYIIRASDQKPELLGGKARALASLSDGDFPIPDWFVVSPKAFEVSLGQDKCRALSQAQETDELSALLEDLYPTDEISLLIEEMLTRMCPNGELVAVRSSASDEDGSLHSFAGQLDSFLFVPPARVAEKVGDVWHSGFGQRVLTYRKENDLPLATPPPSVLIQQMVNPEVSGVAFGADPVSGRRDVAVISALYGVGSLLVSGEGDADTYRIDSEGNIQECIIAAKRTRHCPDPEGIEGVKEIPVEEELVMAPTLDDAGAGDIAKLVRRLGDHFGSPQDIEWGIAEGQLYLLQSRPITALREDTGNAKDGIYNLWDNSNITESYSGLTTPLTFSFVRMIYEEVYRQFCIILRVPQKRIDASDHLFKNMLGLIQGNVFYNLLNWYRVLALLPGFQVNRKFMEQMMGVNEMLPKHVLSKEVPPVSGSRLIDIFRLVRSSSALILASARFSKTMNDFTERMNSALEVERTELSNYNADELVSHFRDLEGRLLRSWDAPLINDFLAMIFSGVLRALCKKWLGNEGLHNDLLAGEGGMISAEPAMRVRELADVAAMNPDFAKKLLNADQRDIADLLPANAEFAAPYEDYLERFGDRCLEELKLESPTLRDNPLPLVRLIGTLALSAGKDTVAARPTEDLRTHAENLTKKTLRMRPIRKLGFAWVLKHARERVRDRENLRFERTRLFGRVRTIFVELGKRLHECGRLEDPRDIFYLEHGEIFGFVEGTATTADLKGLVQVRKNEYETYRIQPPPPDRFETYGIVHTSLPRTTASEEVALPEGESLSGLGCCPGVVQGTVRMVLDPRNANMQAGEILVAERTDPGWVLLFPLASGLLVERGSLLSHSAIVAREMGIPAIVSLTNVTRWLQDGDIVQLDGSTGKVVRIRQANAEDTVEE